MHLLHTLRAWTAIAMILALAAWSGLHWIGTRRGVDAALSRPNPLALDAARFATLAAHLPPTGPVGYVNDWSRARPTPEALRDPELLRKCERERDRLVVAQYALAPHVVMPDTEARWVIASTSNGAARVFAYPAAFALRFDAGDGIALYERVAAEAR